MHDHIMHHTFKLLYITHSQNGSCFQSMGCKCAYGSSQILSDLATIQGHMFPPLHMRFSRSLPRQALCACFESMPADRYRDVYAQWFLVVKLEKRACISKGDCNLRQTTQYILLSRRCTSMSKPSRQEPRKNTFCLESSSLFADKFTVRIAFTVCWTAVYRHSQTCPGYDGGF